MGLLHDPSVIGPPALGSEIPEDYEMEPAEGGICGQERL